MLNDTALETNKSQYIGANPKPSHIVIPPSPPFTSHSVKHKYCAYSFIYMSGWPWILCMLNLHAASIVLHSAPADGSQWNTWATN